MILKIVSVPGCLLRVCVLWFVLSESLDLEILGRRQEGVELVLGDADLAIIHEADNVLEVLAGHAPEVHNPGGEAGGRASALPPQQPPE